MEFRFESQGRQHRIELADGEHLLGRSAEAALQIPVPQVSSRHAQLRIQGARLFIRDLGSTNGTTCAGRSLDPGEGEAALVDGSSFGVAGVPVHWTEHSDPPEDLTMIEGGDAFAPLS